MADVGIPDLTNYRDRLGQICNTIVAGNVFDIPGAGQSAFPFWILEFPTIPQMSKEAAFIWRWRVRWVFVLARGSSITNYDKAVDLAEQINSDIVTVTTYFQTRAAFVSSTLTTNQVGYLPGSIGLEVNGATEYPVKTGVVYGSTYALSLTHRISYDPIYR